MLTQQQLTEAHALTKQIDEAKRLIVEYAKGGDVIVALPAERAIRFSGTQHEVTLRHSEIGGAIVAILERRVETMKAQLRVLGVEWTDESDEAAE